MAAINDALPTLIHEIKNPLAAVTAAIEVMLEDSWDESLQAVCTPSCASYAAFA